VKIVLALKIRGIYSTALTRFFLDQDFQVVLPSSPMAERFAGSPGFDVLQAPDVEVRDLDNKQGVLLEGRKEALDSLLPLLQGNFDDAVIRRRAGDVLETEFPLVSKSRLDGIRGTVVPTLLNHHRLKIIASDELDIIERNTLAAHPDRGESPGIALEKEWVWDRYEKGKEIAIDHVKPDGRVFHLSEGEIMEAEFSSRMLLLKRSRFKGRGRYDGLGIRKEEGDYAVSEIRAGQWHYRHTYFRAQGEKVGTYYNINTPVECYPDRIRYVDLEIDVLEFPDGRMKVVDDGDLSRRSEQGYLSRKTRDKALSEASRLCRLI
jgi:hypothetical protein